MPKPREGLTELGQRIEDLRRAAGLNTQGLARKAAMSRQHLWRISTGRTDVETGDVVRIARALGVAPSELLPDLGAGQWEPETDRDAAAAGSGDEPTPAGRELEAFMSNMERIVHLLSNSSGGDITQAVKIGLLNGIEQVARETGNKLPPEYGEIRRRVINGEL